MNQSTKHRAKILVVTGQTGTGKSTVCEWLAQRGAFVLDADRVGHEILLREETVVQLKEIFSPEIADQRGRIDRARLGEIVFSDPVALQKLNELVHPPLLQEIEFRIAALERSQVATLIVVDAALHFVFSPRIRCDAVLMTKTAPEVQLRRIMERDGLDEERAHERLRRQASIAEHEGEADYVLDTTAAPSQVRRELLLNMDAFMGTSLVLSDPFVLSRHSED